MRWLDGGQSAMMQAIDHGPAHLPEALFAGPVERVLAGMTVHANTISHARLVALEETFPRTRDVIGEDRFNALSRLFLLHPGVTGQPLTSIGQGFDDFLLEQGEGQDAADLARFEWLWLEAYHAADVAPLTLGDLAGLAPEALLDVSLQRHPAAAAGRFAPLVGALVGAEVDGLAEADAVLITRPDSEVLIVPASALTADMFAAAQFPCTIGNLLAPGGEDHDDAATAMPALVALIEAGALIRAAARPD
jgi:Putative DNA-binding domain